MPAKINLINETFGKLKVLEETQQRKNKSVVWKCQCDCGNIVYYSTKELRSDGIIQCPQCGHNRQPKTGLTLDIIGQKFHHLTVLEKTNKKQSGKILYKCECDCPEKTIVYVNRTDLLSGHTQSCGCISHKYKTGDIINNKLILFPIDNKGISGRFYYRCKCLLCGREYDALTQSLNKTFSCGCQKRIGEFNIIQVLNSNNIHYQKEYCFTGSLLRFDFAIFDQNNNIIRLIEFDGEQHYLENVKNSGWNTYQKYEHTLKNDKIKNQIAKDKQIPLIRIPYWERDNITLDILMGDKYLI